MAVTMNKVTALKAQCGCQLLRATSAKLYSVMAAQLRNDPPHEISNENDSSEWDRALPFDRIPGPKPLPLIGNSWRFVKYIGDWYSLDALEIQERCFEKYGPISTLGSLFGRKTVFICDPENIEKLFRNEGQWPLRMDSPSFIHYRTVTRKDMYENKLGIQVLQGKDWYDFRSKVNPIMMNIKAAVQFTDKINSVGDALVDKIDHLLSQAQEGEMPADFNKEMAKFILDNTALIALDKRIRCLDVNSDSPYLPLVDKFSEAFDLLYHMDILPPIWKYIPTPQWNRYVELLDDISSTVMNLVDDVARKVQSEPSKPETEKSLLEKLISLDVDIAKVMAIDMFLIGTDITSKTLCSALYLLAKCPDKQARLREEMIRVLPDKNSPITKDVLDNAHYLKAVVKEVNRVAPVAVGNQRITVKDMVLCGYQIPKGTEIFTSNLILARMDKHYPQARKFIPERWLRSTEGELSYKNTNQFVTLPFGYGARACIGKRFATMELEIGIAKIIRNFELSWPHKDAKFTTIFLHAIAEPLRLHMKRLTT